VEKVSLLVTIASLFELYGRRNAMFLRGDMRVIFLDERVRSFFKAIRKEEKDKTRLANLLASTFSRAIAFADSFVDLPLVQALCEKYPSYGCAYCTGKPCHCNSNRVGEINLEIPLLEQMGWTVQQWVTHMDVVYGNINRNNGIFFAICRLQEEIGEAKAAHHFDDVANSSVTLSMRRLNIAREFADVLAWIFSIASMLDLDLDTTILEQYGGKCYRCGERPCDCGSPFMRTRRSNQGDNKKAGFIVS